MKVGVVAWLVAAVGIFIYLAAQVPSLDWSRVDWIGIPGVLGFGLAALVFTSPVFVAVALLAMVVKRFRSRPIA